MNARTIGFAALSLFSFGFTLHCGSSSPSNGAASDDAGTNDAPTIDSAPSDDAGEVGDAAPVATCPDGTTFTPLAGKIIVDVTIDGGAPMKWILDTGAPSSLLDSSITLGAGTGAGGAHVVHLADKDFSTYHIDSGDVATSLQIPGVVGIFGMDLLTRSKLALTLDYPRSRFWIDDAIDEASLLACPHVAGKPTVAPYETNGNFFVQGKLEDVDGWFLVDSGASLGAVPDDVFDALDAAHPRPAIDGFYTPAFVGTFWARMTAIGAMHVGDLEVDHIVIRTIAPGLLEPPNATSKLLGLLPSGWLHHFMVSLDFSAKTIRFDAAKGDAMKEPATYFSVGIGLEQVTAAPIHVDEVLAGSAAAEAGVQVGDEITTVAGADFASMDPYARPWSLMSSTLGAKIDVVVKRDGAPLTFSLETRDLLTDP